MSNGIKYDDGKRNWMLVPWKALEEVVKVMELGARKYGRFNWQELEEPQRRYGEAAMRHLVAWMKGEKMDPESGLPHLAHLGCNALFLLWFEQYDLSSDSANWTEVSGLGRIFSGEGE
jgi:hypothetical protein